MKYINFPQLIDAVIALMSNEMRVAGKIHNFLITSTTPCLTHTHTIEIATMMSIFSVFKIHYAYMEKLVREGMKKKNFLQFIQFFLFSVQSSRDDFAFISCLEKRNLIPL